MLKRILTSVILCLGLLPLPALADRLVVVELFTSQGCSSCPPADALLGELATRHADVLPLSLHVDYWDYIGWKDSFADPANTARQRAYAAAAGSRMIYTPQMIVGGREHLVGHEPMKLMEVISRLRMPEPEFNIVLAASGKRLSVMAVPTDASGRTRSVNVILVAFTPEAAVNIGRGENAGRTLTYHNIVKRMRTLGTIQGSGLFRAEVPVSDDYSYAVLLQEEAAGPILAAARAP